MLDYRDSWGPVRDDAHKHHPGLIPYEELSDEEKEYDRRTAMSMQWKGPIKDRASLFINKQFCQRNVIIPVE